MTTHLISSVYLKTLKRLINILKIIIQIYHSFTMCNMHARLPCAAIIQQCWIRTNSGKDVNAKYRWNVKTPKPAIIHRTKLFFRVYCLAVMTSDCWILPLSLQRRFSRISSPSRLLLSVTAGKSIIVYLNTIITLETRVVLKGLMNKRYEALEVRMYK